MKKTFCILMALCLLLGMVTGCGSASASAASAASSAPASAEEASTEAAAPAAEAEEPAAEASAAEEPVSAVEEASAEEPAEDTAVDVTAADYMGVPAEEGAYPVFEETRTVTASCSGQAELANLLDGDLSNSLALQQFEEACNIDLVYQLFTDYNTQFGLMMASGDYTDLLETPHSYVSGGIDAVVEGEVCYDLSPWLEEYAPAYNTILTNDPNYKKQITSDNGYICTITTYNTVVNDGPVIRADMLDKLGMDMPLTYDQLHDFLLAAKNEYDLDTPFWVDPKFVFNSGCFTSGFDFVTDAMGFDLPWSVDSEGTVFSPYLSDNYVDYITMVADWYKEGLFNFDYFSGSIMDRDTDILGGEVAYCVGVASMLTDSYAAQSDIADFRMTGAYDVRKTEDQVLTHGGTVTDVSHLQGVGISCTAEDPELLLRVIDYGYTLEGCTAVAFGIEGETFEYDENGTPVFTDMILNNPDGLSPTQAKWKFLTGLAANINSKIVGLRDADNDTVREVFDYWCYNKNESQVYYGTMNTEESEVYNGIYGDIMTYCDESLTKIITGEYDISYFTETFQPTIIEMGMEDLVEIKQAAYDRFMAR